MTSNINPNNIDGAYPVAGQDNNSQGFRDNFTNTKTNFEYAANEITDLQNKAVLKAALTGTTLNNDMQGAVLSNAQLQNMSETVVALGTVSGSATINYALGSYQTLTTNGPVSLAFSNFPAAGVAASVSVQVTVANTSHTLTLPAAVSVNNAGIQGINPTTNVITFAATGVYSFQFVTSNGGTTITVNENNKELQTFNSTGEDITNGAACSLAVTSSKFSTTGSWTATLAAGVAGQMKELIMLADGGDMVITVANAGWKSSGVGTITFNDIGDACTLRFASNKWYCVGNFGCTFA
jgi:uncharacterized surface protein with fasciclin (FAS1) repeats